MALKAKPKSFELEILSEAEVAMDRMEGVVERVDEERPPYASPMSPKWHAGVDIEKLPAMNDAELVVFDATRVKGTYLKIVERGGKYYLGLGRKTLDTKTIKGLIKKGWLVKSVHGGKESYFVTAHMVFGWRKRIGV